MSPKKNSILVIIHLFKKSFLAMPEMNCTFTNIIFDTVEAINNKSTLNMLLKYYYYILFLVGDSSNISIISSREKRRYHSVWQ